MESYIFYPRVGKSFTRVGKTSILKDVCGQMQKKNTRIGKMSFVFLGCLWPSGPQGLGPGPGVGGVGTIPIPDSVSDILINY